MRAKKGAHEIRQGGGGRGSTHFFFMILPARHLAASRSFGQPARGRNRATSKSTEFHGSRLTAHGRRKRANLRDAYPPSVTSLSKRP